MPNHVTSRCTITGPADEVARFRSTAIVTKLEKREPYWAADRQPKEYTTFDFDAVIPMPPILERVEASSAAEEGMALIQARGDRSAPFSSLGLYDARIQWIRDEAGLGCRAHIADVAAAFLEKHPHWEAQGKLRMQALLETGYANWYSWAIDHWGTKWGAYSFAVEADEPLTIRFDTAWSFPTPIFAKLVDQYPTLRFDCICFDEGWNFAGQGVFAADAATFTEVKATDELYEAVYGRKAPKDDDEDEAI